MNGSYEVLTDDKFRISLPVEFKDELMGSVRVITRSIDLKSLQIITKEKFDAMKKKIEERQNADFDRKALMIQRTIIAPGVEIEFDKTLRFMIPRGLRSVAQLESKSPIQILGMGDKIEIWNYSVYNDYIQKMVDEDEYLKSLEEIRLS